MELDLNPEEQRIARRLDREDTVTGWVILVLGLMVLSAGGILAWQCVRWLHRGEWPSLTWSDAAIWAGLGPLDLPDGRGVEKILRWLGTLPLWFLPIATASGLTVWWFRDKPESEEDRLVRQKIARKARRS